MAKPEKILALEMVGREVLDLSAGEVVGDVQDLALSRGGRVVAIGLLPCAWYEGGKGIAPEKVASVHHERICIDGQESLGDFLGEDTFSMYESNLLTGKQVLQQDGEMLGILTDFNFELTSGKITELIVLGADERRSKVVVDTIRTIGSEYIIIDRGQPVAETAADEKPASAPAKASSEKKPVAADTPPDVPPELEAAPPPPPPSAGGDKSGLSGDALFKEETQAGDVSAFDAKKRRFVLGRAAHRDIKDQDGKLIIAKGKKIDQKALDAIIAAETLGEVFIEMTLKK